MKRAVLRSLIVIMLILITGCEDGIDRGKKGLVKVGEGVYAYIAAGPSSENNLGSNTGFIVGTEGVLVVDSRYTPKLAGDLLEAVRTVTDLPVKYLVNTHYHPVNVWGNSVFRKEGAVIIARPETIRDIEKYSPIYMNYYKDNNPDEYKKLKNIVIALPDSAMGDRMSLDLGGVDVTLSYFGPAHTEGDCVVSVDGGKVIFTGGILSKGYHPNMADPGADFNNWLNVLERLKKMNPEYLIPGEGNICVSEDIELQREYIVGLRDMCREEIRKATPVSSVISAAAKKTVIPGSENYYNKNILGFNIRALFRHEVLPTVNPGFKFDLPKDFHVGSGGGNSIKGNIFWARQTENGYEEIEVQWKPTTCENVIIQDLYDRINSFKCAAQQRELKLKGKKRFLIGGKPVKAAEGAWFQETRTVHLRGWWTMALIIEDGKSYTILCATTAGGKEEMEQESIKTLEAIASTFRIISEEKAADKG